MGSPPRTHCLSNLQTPPPYPAPQRPNFLTLLFNLLSPALDTLLGISNGIGLLTAPTFVNGANMVTSLLAPA